MEDAVRQARNFESREFTPMESYGRDGSVTEPSLFMVKSVVFLLNELVLQLLPSR